jgi:nitrate reductase gamma subunit
VTLHTIINRKITAVALALLLGCAVARAQAPDAATSASTKSEAPAAAKPDATTSASVKSEAPKAEKADATSSASKTGGEAAGAGKAGKAGKAGPRHRLFRHDLYDLVLGPAFVIAWILFAAGFAWRVFQFARMTNKTLPGAVTANPVPVRPDTEFLLEGRTAIGRLFTRYHRWERRTIFHTNPVMARVSVVFHVLLFLVPLLLPAHNILFYQGTRLSVPTLPEPLVDKLTLLLLAFGAFFLLRRILIPRVRVLSTVRDYLVLLLVAAPFVTAYMAYHHWLDYRIVVLVHMILGELLIAAIPFTKLGHMPFLIFARFFAASERAWSPGNRRW